MLAISCIGVMSVACRPPIATPVHTPERAHTGLLAAFDAHPIVLLGESHRSVAFHRFLRELVERPDFPTRVNDIVVEFGNSRYQPLLDRYIAGDSVPHDSLQLVWRNTTQLLAWDSPLYEQFYATVRRVNAALPPQRMLRVLAGDPPIDWTRTSSPADFPRSYGDRDIETLHIIEHEVLARGRAALVVIGGAHIYREGPGDAKLPRALERAALGDQLQRTHPGSAFIAETVFGEGGGGLASLVAERLKPGEMLRIAGTSLGDTSSSVLFGAGITRFRTVNGVAVPITLEPSDFPPLSRTVDAVIYVANENPRLLAAPSVYKSDPAFVAEIRRRIQILTQVFGGDFWTDELDAQLKTASP